MKLHDNQLYLLWHLARFNLMDYRDCLTLLDTEGTDDRTALSYAFRPLTKNRYLSKDKNGCVSILAKGRSLFPHVTPLISTGGGVSVHKRVMEVSRMAVLMEHNGIPCFGERQETDKPYFIPSACWRKIAPGILSTTRFVGMLLMGKERLAVYDIGNGKMDWQIRAEGSLFYTRYGSYETRATGMLLVCREELREKIAENIIRQTMWQRRQLLKERCAERNRPVRWSHSPIKLHAKYERVYLTTPGRLRESIRRIQSEKEYIQGLAEGGTILSSRDDADIERDRCRLFVNPACDLLKYVRFFASAKTYLGPSRLRDTYFAGLSFEIYLYPEDTRIAHMYPDVTKMEGVTFYAYQA